MSITHSIPADNSFTPQGKAAWNAAHTMSGIVFSGDFSSAGAYQTALEALTDTLGANAFESSNDSGLILQTQGAQFVIQTSSTTFNGQRDDISNWGYNINLGQVPGSSGSRSSLTEPQLFHGLEGHYFDLTTHWCEWNFDYLSSDGATSKRFMGFAVNRATHSGNWNWSGDLFLFSGTGGSISPQFGISTANSTTSANYLTAYGRDAGSGPILQATGTDNNINVEWRAKGTGGHYFMNIVGTIQFFVGGPSGANRYIEITGSNGGNPTINVTGGSLSVTATVVTNSSITTGAPASGTAAAWKFGIAASVSPTSPNRTIELDVGGTIYYLHAKTTNN